jgi:hypothetical protein
MVLMTGQYPKGNFFKNDDGDFYGVTSKGGTITPVLF